MDVYQDPCQNTECSTQVTKFQYSRDVVHIIRKYGETESGKEAKGQECHLFL